MNLRIALTLLFLTACATPSTVPRSSAPPVAGGAPASVRLYTLDCGRLEVADIGYFEDAGKPIGKAQTMSVPCFIIRHPKGTLLWDTGLDESIHKSKDGHKNPVATEFVDTPLDEQLAALSLSPSQVTYVGLSHLHLDHAGNANIFASSTWLLARKELDAALATPPPTGVDLTKFSAYRSAKIDLLDSDRDVFGDGTVVILQTPGHTPGHQSLMLRLEHAGTVILSGDLAHTRRNWEKHVVPAFNYSREQTLASIGRVEKLLAETHGRLIVQHAVEDFRALPKFPASLD